MDGAPRTGRWRAGGRTWRRAGRPRNFKRVRLVERINESDSFEIPTGSFTCGHRREEAEHGARGEAFGACVLRLDLRDAALALVRHVHARRRDDAVDE